MVGGVLNFGISGNHVGLIEGQSARGRMLERYLTSLFQRAGELDDGETVVLNAKLKGSLSEVNGMTIAPAKSMAKPKKNVDGKRPSPRRVTEADGIGTTVLEVLRVLGWEDDQVAELEKSLPDGGWLEGVFKVMFKASGRKASPVNRAVLEEALRNLGPAAVGLVGDGTEKRGMVKLSRTTSIDTIGALLDPASAMLAIVDQMHYWARRGDIDATFEK